MSAAPARVLIAGNDLLAGALAGALETHGFVTLRVGASSREIQRGIDWKPDLMIMDGRSLKISTASVLVTQLCATDCPVCVIDAKDDEERWTAWRRAEPSALVDRSEPFDQLFSTLARLLRRAVPQGTGASSRAFLASALRNHPDGASLLRPFATLTEREAIVLSELMEGHSAEEIAKASFVSISTVRSQIKSILQKLGVNSQLAAVALARRAGWSLDSPRKTSTKAVKARRRRVS